MLAWLWLGVRLGVRVGIISGLVVGLIAAVGGSLFTNSLADLAVFSINGFWLICVISPVAYYLTFFSTPALIANRDEVHHNLYIISAGAWLPAFLIGVVTFMMPVVMMPVILGWGVTVENSAGWYDQVYTLLEGRVVMVAIADGIGYAVAAYLLRARFS